MSKSNKKVNKGKNSRRPKKSSQKKHVVKDPSYDYVNDWS